MTVILSWASQLRNCWHSLLEDFTRAPSFFCSYPEASPSTPIFVSNLACDTLNPSHLTLYHCPRTSGSSCTHSQDVAVICDSPYTTGNI